MPEPSVRILHVEDDAADAELALHELRKDGLDFEALRVETREAFLGALESFAPDLVLTDYKLPDFDGMAALLLAQERAPDVPVIITTGSLNEETAVACMRAGAADYVLKDSLARLGGAARSALEKRKLVLERRRDEAVLAASEERYRSLVDAAVDAIITTDEAGRVAGWNHGAERIFGHRADEILGRPVTVVMPADYRGRHQAGIDRMRSGGEPRILGKTIEMEGLRKDGSVFPLELSLTSWRAATGRFYTAIIRDITDRERAETALRANEARLRSLFEGMLEGYAHCEMLFEGGVAVDWVYRDVNPAFEKLTGLKDVVGKRVTEVIPGIRTANPELFEIYGRVASTGEAAVFEDRVLALRHWYAVSAYCPRKGEFVAVFDDITERKEAEERLARSELYFRSIIENSLDITVVVAPDTRLLFVSPAAERLLGHRLSDLQGTLGLEIVHPEDRSAVENAFGRVLEDGARVGEAEFRVRHRDGSWRTLAAIARRLAPETGIDGVIVNSRDISDRLQLQAQLIHAQRMEAVGRLAGGVAHDFNNLLTVVAGYAELLDESLAGDPERRESVVEILKAAGRATALTRQLLAFSRRQVLEMRVLDVGGVVADTEKMLKRLIGEDVEVVVTRPADLGRVKADAGQVEQVLLNLAVNARDAMPGGGRLSVELANVRLREPLPAMPEVVPEGRYVVIAVADTGSGMDAETMSHAFEPFFTTKERGKGTGLGLATVYGIVRQSGGFVALESAPGAGTTFRIYLPRCDEPPPSGVRPAVRTHRGSETVLLVEDEAAVRSLARTVLDRNGYTVIEAEDGGAALDVVDRDPRPIHVLLTDLVMPGMNGRDLAKAVTARRPAVKVVYMSGYAAEIATEFTADGAVGFVPKPFTERSLTAKIREVLDTRLA